LKFKLAFLPLLAAGIILSVFFCTIMGSMALGQLAPPMTSFISAKAAVRSLLDVVNRKPLIDGLSPDGERPQASSQGAIEIKAINFAYPSRPNITVCRNYDLSIAAGESVALVGASGCGKVRRRSLLLCSVLQTVLGSPLHSHQRLPVPLEIFTCVPAPKYHFIRLHLHSSILCTYVHPQSTIINLLLRFYDPQSGSICLDGHDIKALNIRWLRHQIGYVGQEPILFAGTVADNIAYGLPPEMLG
jgi:ABC-type multidrug transport system fused ATPase/permease subunit